MPDVDLPQREQGRKEECARHLHELGAHQQSPAIHSVGDDSANQGEKEDRDLAEKGIEPQHPGGVRQLEDEPALRDGLHPGADARDTGPYPKPAEVAVCKCRECSAEKGRGRRSSRYFMRADTIAHGRGLGLLIR